MHGKIKQAFQDMGLTVDGNKAYGALHGFETNAQISAYNLMVHVSMYVPTEESKSAIIKEMAAFTNKYFIYQWTKYGVTLILNDFTEARLAKRLPELLEKVYATFTNNGARGAGFCPVCGQPLDFENAKKCLIDGFTVSIDNDCVERINTAISEENKDFNAAPNNYFKGFLGALVGGLAGVAVAVILNLIGFISAISSFVAFFVGILLYQKFGGKPNKMMIVIVTLTTFVLMMLSTVGMYLVAAAVDIQDQGYNYTVLEYLISGLREDPEYAQGFYTNLAMTALFTIVGCVYEIIAFSKKIKRPKNI